MLLKVVPLGRVENVLKFIVLPFRRQLIPSSAFISPHSSRRTETRIHIVRVLHMGDCGFYLSLSFEMRFHLRCCMSCGWLIEIFFWPPIR